MVDIERDRTEAGNILAARLSCCLQSIFNAVIFSICLGWKQCNRNNLFKLSFSICHTANEWLWYLLLVIFVFISMCDYPFSIVCSLCSLFHALLFTCKQMSSVFSHSRSIFTLLRMKSCTSHAFNVMEMIFGRAVLLIIIIIIWFVVWLWVLFV